jgi:ribonuclease HI
MDDDALIKELEGKLLDPKVRGSCGELKKLISPRFIEYGSSGKIYNYPGTLAYLVAHAGETFTYSFVNFKTYRLSEDIILALYILETEKNHRISITNRSSLWRLEEDPAGRGAVWRVIFHQGTRVTG